MAVSTIDPAGLNIGQIGGRRNILYNSAMQIAQRGTSFTVSAVGTYTLDRFVVDESTSGSLTVSQDTESPDDFKYSMKITPAVADTSIAAAEYARIKVHLEGYDTNRFAFGTSSAKAITFSFYAKTNKTGTYCAALDLLGGTERTYVGEFSLTNSWARYELNIPANTAQAFASTTNGKAAELEIALAAGSDYHGTAGDFTNAGFATSNQINFMDSTSNELYITGLQLEVGDVATPFEHRSVGEEYLDCLRYYRQWGGAWNGNKKEGITNAMAYGTTDAYGVLVLPVPMRTIPSAVFVDYPRIYGAGTTARATYVAIGSSESSGHSVRIQMNRTSFYTAGNATWFQIDTVGEYFALDAEL